MLVEQIAFLVGMLMLVGWLNHHPVVIHPAVFQTTVTVNNQVTQMYCHYLNSTVQVPCPSH